VPSRPLLADCRCYIRAAEVHEHRRIEVINYKTNRPSELPCVHAPGLGSEELQVLGRQQSSMIGDALANNSWRTMLTRPRESPDGRRGPPHVHRPPPARKKTFYSDSFFFTLVYSLVEPPRRYSSPEPSSEVDPSSEPAS
jgi:hypothetical protein